MPSRPAVAADETSVSRFELESVHENLLAWMAALDELIGQERCRLGQLETVRWFLSKARRDRRVLLEQIYTFLIDRAGMAETEALRSMRALSHRTMEAGSQHFAKWSLEAIKADWAGYRADTRVLRESWTQAIETERQLLYPLLGRHS